MTGRTYSRPPFSRLAQMLGLSFLGWIIVFAAMIQPAAAESDAATPISPTGVNAAAPAVAVAADGTVHVAWEQADGIWYRRRLNQVWQNAVQVSVEGEHPAVAVSSQRVIVAWSQEFGGRYEIFVRSWDDASGWQNPLEVSHTDGSSVMPVLAVGPSGDVHLLWADTTPGASTIYHAISSDGGLTWPVATPIADALGNNPTAVFDANGDLVAAWQYRASFAEKLRVWTSRYHDGVWSPPAPLTDGSQHALAPALGAGDAQLALAWQEGDAVKLALWRSNDWQLVAAQTGDRPAVAITRQAVVQWAWETADGLASQFGRDGWTTPVTWVQADPQSGDLVMAAHGDDIIRAWTATQSGASQVFVDAATLGALYLPIIR